MATELTPSVGSAVCVRCGAPKTRALASCDGCGYTATDEGATALSLVLSRQFSSSDELATMGSDIRAGRKWAAPAKTMARAQAVARAMFAKKSEKSNTAAVQAPGVSTMDAASVPSMFALNSFHVLGATPRDDRRRIVGLADERALAGDTEQVSKARAELTHPRARLTAEMGWLPGVSPKRAAECLAVVASDPLRAFEQESVPPLPMANLLASAFETVEPTSEIPSWTDRLCRFASVVENVDLEAVRRHINEDRTVSGFTEISASEWVEAEFAEQRNVFKRAILGWLDRFPAKSMLEVLTGAVDSATQHGAKHAPRLLEEVVADFELSAQPAFLKGEKAIGAQIDRIKTLAPRGEAETTPAVDSLERVVRDWDLIAKPAQVCAKSRGEEHAPSQVIAGKIRSLSVDLANDHSMYSVSDRLTRLLQDVFSVVNAVAEKAAEDAAAIKNLLDQKAKASKDLEEFERAITYNADVGMLFKTRLALSPQGFQWGSTRFTLEGITRVRWGAVRHSINGIPTGTTYHVAVGDNSNLSAIELKTGSVYQKFIDKLWRAVGPRLMVSYATDFKAGKALRFGEIIVHDDWCEVPKHKFFGNDRVQAPWAELKVWTANGSFVVGLKSDDKAYGSASYKDSDNAHILEAMIRMFFKDAKARRISEALLG